MRVLLDECLPKRLKSLLVGHECSTAPENGWAGVKNGKLLKFAEQEFDIFLTMDRNLSFQNPVADFKIAVIVIRAKSNRLHDLLPLIPTVLEVMAAAPEGRAMFVG